MRIINGVWLRWWVQVASALSNMGMFVAEISSDSYQIMGMAARGMLPVIGILFSTSGVVLLS
ncbi:hypothetical protein IEQ34_015092 [Dendrobium chrysotoxum]|uniref:Uncharacterized protein n=1 Tax=Dendrobium chrysotoxum TaxID=161865 RepID=A0AAV7G5P5_DENCH|nr:hypothetical protein IEQ34_015092 [Dendrobium chrysotoxum]